MTSGSNIELTESIGTTEVGRPLFELNIDASRRSSLPRGTDSRDKRRAQRLILTSAENRVVSICDNPSKQITKPVYVNFMT